MSGIYFKADKTYGGQLRFDDGKGFVLTPRGSKEQELVPVAEIERISPVQAPAWFNWLKSPITGFVAGFLLGGIVGSLGGSELGFFGSGLSMGVVFAVLAWLMPKFLASQLLLVEAKGRAPFRIQIPAKVVKHIQAQHAPWFA